LDFIKRIHISTSISAIFSVIIGILLIVYPEDSIALMATAIGVILIISGAIIAISQMIEYGTNVPGTIVGVIVLLLGIWIVCSPTRVASLIPIAIGVMIVIHGLSDLRLAVQAKKANADKAYVPFILAIISIAIGVLCIVCAFGILEIGFIVIGIMLVYDGLSDLFIVHKVNKANRDIVDGTITKEEDIY